MKIMSVDFGDARTGIAISDPTGTLASPVCVIHEKDFSAVVEKTAGYACQLCAETIVVGYPKNMNGTIGDRAEKSKRFSDELSKLCGIPVKLWDERCTTVSAHVFMNATDLRGKKRKNSVDAAAAMIILQDYLDFLKNSSGF